jgi:hypothetical protein
VSLLSAVFFLASPTRASRAYYLAESVKDLVEVDEYLSLGDLGDVVHALAGIVPNAGILVREAGEYGGHDLLEVAGDFLQSRQRNSTGPPGYQHLPGPKRLRRRPGL